MGIKLINESGLSSVADAIRAKTGTSDPLAFPDGFVSAVEAIPTGGGGGSVPAKEVNFRDYDGTVVYSYTPAEFAALSAMPANPDHSGDEIPLTAQGWNWSLSDAQAYVAKYGRLEVGQMYKTTDGKTHVLIHLGQGRTSPLLGCCPNGTVDVDWGDGTAHDTLTGTSTSTVKWTPTHNYAAPGDYDIKLTCTGTMAFYGDTNYSGLLKYSVSNTTRNIVYLNAIRAVFCSDNITTIKNYGFKKCYSLSNITIPNSITSFGTSCFELCYALPYITITNSATFLTGAFIDCHSMSAVSISNSVTNFSDAFSKCYAMSNVTIPNSVTSINGYGFYICYSLSNITIPESITSIGEYTFYNCSGLGEIHFTSATPPTVSASNAFTSLPSDCKIYVPTASLDAYKSATNYPSASSYTYIGE